MKKTMLLPVLILAASVASAQDLRVVGDEVDEEAGRPRAYFEGAQAQAGVSPVVAGSPSQSELATELKYRLKRAEQLNREIPGIEATHEGVKEYASDREVNYVKGVIFGSALALVAGVYALNELWAFAGVFGGLSALVFLVTFLVIRSDAKRGRAEASRFGAKLEGKKKECESNWERIREITDALN